MAELGHELGNVLHGLLGMTQLVRDSALTVEQDQWLKAIEHSGQQMCRLVDAFHPGRRAGLAEACPDRIDGIELLEQVVISHAPASLAKHNRLLLTVDPGLSRYWRIDPCELRQLLDNLLGNALKFTRKGEVELAAFLRPRRHESPEALVLVVADTGPGIDAEVARRMFRAYEQGPEQVRDGSEGYGLGLYICRRIARSLGGEIYWSAPESGGARFEVRLPGVVTPAAAPSPPLSRILGSICCSVDLTDPLLRSVAGCLGRLGVRWHAAGQAAGQAVTPAAIPGKGETTVETLPVAVGEIDAAGAHPGSHLVLQADFGPGETGRRKILLGPVLESSLGPLLLELALEWLWVRNGGAGSGPGRRRSAQPGGPVSRQG